MNSLVTTVRAGQYAIEQATANQADIKAHVRITSPTLTQACMQRGLSRSVAETCGGVLATVIDDLIECGRLPKRDFGRTKAKQRILSVTEEPAVSAFRIAVAASPINGLAAVAHWDAICEKYEVGKLAWLLGMDTDTSWRYGKRMEKRSDGH